MGRGRQGTNPDTGCAFVIAMYIPYGHPRYDIAGSRLPQPAPRDRRGLKPHCEIVPALTETLWNHFAVRTRVENYARYDSQADKMWKRRERWEREEE